MNTNRVKFILEANIMKSLLRETLKDHGITVTELARKTGISRSLLSQLANSKQIPGKTRIDVITRIMASLRCNFSDILQPEISNIHISYTQKLESTSSPTNTDRYITFLELKIEGVVNTFPLLISTVNEPPKDIFTGEYTDNKKVTLSLNVDLLNNQDKVYLCRLDKRMEKYFPETYTYENAKNNLLSIKFAIEGLSLFLLDNNAFSLKKYDLTKILMTYLDWNISETNINPDFILKVDFYDSNKISVSLETEDIPLEPHIEISNIFKKSLKQIGSKNK